MARPDQMEARIVECSGCRTAFASSRPERDPNYCSAECVSAAWAAAMVYAAVVFEAERAKPTKVKRPTEIVCAHCGGIGQVKPRGRVPRFCCTKCRVEHRKEHKHPSASSIRPSVAEPENHTPPTRLRDTVPEKSNGAPPKPLVLERSAPPARAAKNGTSASRKLNGSLPSSPVRRSSNKSTVEPSKRKASGSRSTTRSDWPLLRRSLREARPYRVRIAAFFGLSLLSTPLALLTPVPLAVAIDSALGSEPLPALLSALVPSSIEQSSKGVLVISCVLLVAVAALSALQSLGTNVLEASTGEKLTLHFQSKLLQHVQRLSFAFHDSRGTADSIYRIQYDSKAVQSIAIRTLIPVVTALFTLVSMLVIILRIDVQLALVAIGVSPLLFFYARFYRTQMRPKYKQASRLESSALSVVQEVLTSFRVVKSFGREEDEKHRFVTKGSEGVAARIGLTIGEGAFALIVNVTTAIGTALVIYIGVSGVQRGALTLGSLLLVLSYIAQLYGPLKTLSSRSASLQRQLASAERAFELLDEIPDVQERPNAKPIRRAKGHLELRDVAFSYEGKSDVLRHVSVDIPAGSRVGIAGRTGAGKTTLVSLLARFYDPSEGSILLDGVDIRDYRLKDLRRQFTIMLQEPVLFSTSIAENVAYARPDATHEEIVAATRMAGAHEFVSELPDGYDTVVGERGMSLSGGERQRLSLARAFLFDAPILILDEPTSSIDVETEANIMEAMEELMVGRTTFMIAHRLSTLQRCDQRLEIECGRTVEPKQRGAGSTPQAENVYAHSRG